MRQNEIRVSLWQFYGQRNFSETENVRCNTNPISYNLQGMSWETELLEGLISS